MFEFVRQKTKTKTKTKTHKQDLHRGKEGASTETTEKLTKGGHKIQKIHWMAEPYLFGGLIREKWCVVVL